MKNSLKFAAGLVLVAGALVASGTAAQAGEGGAAGSVSIKFATTNSAIGPLPATTPDVARLSSSVAVGKNFAAATSLTETAAGGETRTSAIGAAGTATLTDANKATAEYLGFVEVDTIAANQTNQFGGGNSASLAPITGVTLP
ncbi:hypothetical protein [Chamaesiphon sp. VAR_48_metabat_403]|uniref:hypothetical protein n=1 Tax=Chamaesiphon sp. VAR_48_metabat_403 TaxID=2964700 RepID=UPI00286E2941|nr:hypothetical protein [Chamaesiphon sp. VAR_48_metabat_403]